MGQGLGKQFLAEAISALPCSVEQLFLEVRDGNHAAVALYESAGFNQVGVRPNYYKVPGQTRKDDALLYAMELRGL